MFMEVYCVWIRKVSNCKCIWSRIYERVPTKFGARNQGCCWAIILENGDPPFCLLGV